MISDQTKALTEKLNVAANARTRCWQAMTTDQEALQALTAKVTERQATLTSDKAAMALADKAITEAFVAYAISLANDIGVKLPVTIPGPKP